MVKAFTRADPTGAIVRAFIYGSGGTGTYQGSHVLVRLPFPATSTGNAGLNWINPETGTIAARPFLFVSTAGTGTFDMGTSSDGTGSNDSIIDGGTLAVGIVSRVPDLGTAAGTTGTAGTVGTRTEFFLLGPGGTGTNNSIVAKHSDGIVSTLKGAFVVDYFLIGPGA